jgi:hypothetical protein
MIRGDRSDGGEPMVRGWRLRPAALAAIGCLALGVLALAAPHWIAERFASIDAPGFRSAALAVVRCIGGACIVGAAALVASLFWSPTSTPACIVGGSLIAGGVYLCLTFALNGWLVDDAAITFSYSENLATGHGLVLHPGHAPEEAYSNTLWLLILAAIRAVGIPIPGTAKILSLVAAVLTLHFAWDVAVRVAGRRVGWATFLLWLALSSTEPFLIWSVSGLEHSLEGLLLVLMVRSIVRDDTAVWPCAWSGAALVLLRPEAPLLLGGFALALAHSRWSKTRAWADVRRLWPLVLLPFASLVALVAFRVSYFGDPLPNPYYAKASDSSWFSVLNPVGGGWSYTLDWLRSDAVLCVLPLWWLVRWRDVPAGVRTAVGLVAGQVAFVLYARGDWMTHWRFLCVAVPLLAIVTVWVAARLESQHPAIPWALATTAASALVAISTLVHYVEFTVSPETPYEHVAHVGGRFADAGHRMGIAEPTLAHHDAGGTSFRSVIDLIDLGGLGDRAIAKHMRDRTFIQDYLFVRKRPDFIFGSMRFGAAKWTRFQDSEAFHSQYVPIMWADDPMMVSGLSHVRRDRVREAPGIEVVREHGEIVEVRVK